MQRKINYLVLSSVLLSSIAPVLYYHIWLLPPSNTTKFTSTTTIASLDRTSTPFPSTFSLTIKLLAFNRAISLHRCLASLALADYDRDRVNLHVFVDHFQSDGKEPDVLDSELEESRRVLEVVDGFQWEHGEKVVHYRARNGGLQLQWLESWWPVSDDEFVYVVEDDVEVSSLYYRFLKGLIAKYYYDRENFSPYIYGASLQRLEVVIGLQGSKLELDAEETRLILHPLVGTWGQLLFPRPWKEFRLWYDNNKSKGIKPILNGTLATDWYMALGEKVWTPWIIKFAHSRNYFNIYTNFKDGKALSVSHREPSVNYATTAGPDSRLLEKNSLDFDLWELRPLGDLKRFDYCSRPVLPGRSAGSFDELDTILKSLQEPKTILLLRLYHAIEPLIKNLLCHLERLNIRSYIFIGNDYELLNDLARRGHPVVDGTKFSHSLSKDRLSSSQNFDTELANEVMVTAYVLRKCLEHGYDAWIVDGNMAPISADFMATPDSSHHFVVAKDADFLLVRSSQTTLNVWSDGFIFEVARAAGSSVDYGSSSIDRRYFSNLVGEVLKDGKYASATIGVHVMRPGLRLGDHATFLSLKYSRKFVSWQPDMGLDFLRRELEIAGMWLLDNDSSCNSVFCHQQ